MALIIVVSLLMICAIGALVWLSIKAPDRPIMEQRPDQETVGLLGRILIGCGF